MAAVAGSAHKTPTTASHAVVSGPFPWIGRGSSGSGDGRRPRRQAQTVENLLNGVGRVDRCDDFHTSPAARAFEDVQLPYSFHEFGPYVNPAVPAGSPLQCFLCSCCRSRRGICPRALSSVGGVERYRG